MLVTRVPCVCIFLFAFLVPLIFFMYCFPHFRIFHALFICVHFATIKDAVITHLSVAVDSFLLLHLLLGSECQPALLDIAHASRFH
ncbi:hypothetical protein V5799_011107 [Amblyomma americanum]|uniref:Uncharacterized protein n=1 Tax=Amblyomma americanum TaxID=6943 RepID=A0AAQ4EIB1_AMBAM